MNQYSCLFLDLDGVLIAGGPRPQRRAYYQRLRDNREPDGYGSPAHPLALVALQHIVDAVPDLRIVISASAGVMGLDYLRAMWAARQYPGSVYAVTPRERDCHVRGREIRNYLWGEGAMYPVRDWMDPCSEQQRVACTLRSYCILDDDNDLFVPQARHFVQTDGQAGLTWAKAQRVVRILQRKKIHGV